MAETKVSVKSVSKEGAKAEPKNKKLVRVDLFFAQSIEEDIMEAFTMKKVGYHYSKIENVTGKGYSNPKLGDAIWPQVNEMLIVICPSTEAEKIYAIVKDIRKKYPIEGIACFSSEVTEH